MPARSYRSPSVFVAADPFQWLATSLTRIHAAGRSCDPKLRAITRGDGLGTDFATDGPREAAASGIGSIHLIERTSF